MKEEYDGERTIVKLTEKDISQIRSGKILNGFKIDIGLEIKE